MGGPDASLTCRRPTVGRRGAPNFLIGPRGRARETDRAGRPSGRLNPEFLRRSARGPVRVKNGSHNSRPDGQSFTAAPVGTEFCQRSACARRLDGLGLDWPSIFAVENVQRRIFSAFRAGARVVDGLGPGRTSVRHGFRCFAGVGRRRLFGALRSGLFRCFRRRRRSRPKAPRGWSFRAPPAALAGK